MKLDDLERCVIILMNLAKMRGINEVKSSENDAYWTISSPAWTQIYEEPNPSVGSLSDDEEELIKVLGDPTRASAVDLDRVAHLLRRLSDQLAY